MSKCSFAQISADKVLKACDAYLEARETRITTSIKELIDAEMNRRFFPAKTEEIAYSRLKEDILYIRIGGAFWARAITELRELAAISDGPVYVSAEDVYTLREYWE